MTNTAKTLSKTTIALMVVGMLTAAGCNSNAVEADYGNSVRHMISAQTANPNAPVDSEAIDGTDAERAQAALEAHRQVEIQAPGAGVIRQ